MSDSGVTNKTDGGPEVSDDHTENTGESQAVLLASPAEGVPDPITTESELADAVARFAAGTGPVAIDAERASGYRYSQRAYLVQMRREGAGTLLIDPIALPHLHELNDAIHDAEWVVHAANQDLPCLAEVGLVPTKLFDSELAGRLLGEDRVALGTMVEQYLGVRLEKGHSAADWSQRPLPHEWLVYAALDVELLIPLRDVLMQLLIDTGKDEWAAQEFESVRLAPPAAPKPERWRRTSGIHAVRTRRGLASVRAMWQARDDYARRRDIAPGRILPDSAIISAARSNAMTEEALAALPIFGGPRQSRHLGIWLRALASAAALSERDLPTMTSSPDTVPPTSRWKERSPEAAERLARCRACVAELSEEYNVLAQNLLPSEVLRRLVWRLSEEKNVATDLAPTADSIAAALEELGARPWQIAMTASAIANALVQPTTSAPEATESADSLPEPSAAEIAQPSETIQPSETD